MFLITLKHQMLFESFSNPAEEHDHQDQYKPVEFMQLEYCYHSKQRHYKYMLIFQCSFFLSYLSSYNLIIIIQKGIIV